jgi:hypothetical protein
MILKLFKDDVSIAEMTYCTNMVLEKKSAPTSKSLNRDGIAQFRRSRLFYTVTITLSCSVPSILQMHRHQAILYFTLVVPQLRRVVASFPPRRPGFDPRSRQVGFVVDKLALGQVFTDYFGFPCQFSFHQLLHTHLSSGAGTIGQLVADIPRGLTVPSHPNKIKKKFHIDMAHLQNKATISDKLTFRT